MKKLLLLSFLIYSLPLYAQNKSYEINGEIPVADGTVYLNSSSNKITDSAIIKNGKFHFNGSIDDLEFITLTYKNERLPTVLESGKLNIKMLPGKFKYADISGEQSAIDFKTCLLLVDSFQNKIQLINKSYQLLNKKDSIAMIAFGKENDNTFINKWVAIKDWVVHHLSSMVSPYIIQTELQSLGIFEQEDLFNRLNPKVKACGGGQDLASFIKSKKTFRIGQIASDFTQNDTTGSTFSLRSLKGNYVLVEFWASWCKPCRQQNPALVTVYNQFKDKKLKIIGVSLDENKTSWLNAIQADKLTWCHVSDLKGWKNDVAKLYGIGAVPNNFLIDPDNKIIAINIDPETLAKKLNSLMP
jgi:peroxiredoxin